MRDVPADVLASLQKSHGTEPVLIIEIQWVDNGPSVMYSDQKLSGGEYPYPTIIQVSNFDVAMLVGGSGDSQQISITLDDVDGALKTMLDANDIHKRPVWVYQGFKGLTINHKFLLFKGELSSPIVWSEGHRTLTFDVLTPQEEAEVGFSMEEGDFLSIPNEALGVVWPLVFGEVCNMKVPQIRAPRRGILTSGEGVHDFTLINRICQARRLQCPVQYTGLQTTIQSGTVVKMPTYQPDYSCIDDRWATVCQLEYLLDQQLSYEHTEIQIQGGNNFPQGETVTLNIGGVTFIGTFAGETFHVIERIHPEFASTTLFACREIPERHRGLMVVSYFTTDEEGEAKFGSKDPNWQLSNAQTVYAPNPNSPDLGQCIEADAILMPGMAGGPSASQKALDDMPVSSFFWLPPGSEAFLEDEAEIMHIISLLPGTVNHVAAYKTQLSGRKLLLEVPTDYYTIYETDYDGYTVVELGMDMKLSLRDSTWTDDLYVSYTSDVGPNPVDIIQWLVEKYTTLTTDSASFTAVRTSMVNYPTNFALKTRRNVLTLVQDIAYQTRCAVYIRNGVIFIKYLAVEPTSVRTITASDILTQSFEVSLTPSEDLITKSVISWEETGAGVVDDDKIEKVIMLKHNIPKYGVQEETYDYFTQNTYSTILKSATFWLIRQSHTWKYIEFDTTIQHLDLDLFDCITLNLSQFSSTPVKCILTDIQFNSQNNTIHFKAWTPIRAGTAEPYQLAWTADLPVTTVWPLDGETRWADPGYDFNITPPLGHILSGGDTTELENFVPQTSGDRHPSDSGDTLPGVACKVSSFEEDNLDVSGEPPVFEALNLAKRNRQEGLKTGGFSKKSKEETGGGGGTKEEEEEKEERDGCGGSQGGAGCVYEVNVTRVLPTAVSTGAISQDGCNGAPCNCSQPGLACIGDLSVMCQAFSTRGQADQYLHSVQAEILSLQSCGYQCGVLAVYTVSGVKAIPDTSPPSVYNSRSWGPKPPPPTPCVDEAVSLDEPYSGVEFEPKDV